MVSGKVDNGRIKGLPYRKQKDVSGLWAGKQVLFTAMIGRDEFTQFSSGECSKFRQVAVCSYFTLPFVLTGKKKKGEGKCLLSGMFFFVFRTSNNTSTSSGLENRDISYFESLGLFCTVIIKDPKFSFYALQKITSKLLDKTRG